MMDCVHDSQNKYTGVRRSDDYRVFVERKQVLAERKRLLYLAFLLQPYFCRLPYESVCPMITHLRFPNLVISSVAFDSF